jgi:hypothetical protein
MKKETKEEKAKTQERVVRFGDYHKIGLDCFNASDLHFAYGKFGMSSHAREDNDGKRDLAGPKPEGRAKKANMGIFEVFRDKVKLRWRDYDDNPIEYEFYFEDIFKDKIIPHLKEDEDLIFWDDPIGRYPGIIIEVDNRTLNIYSDINVHLVIPGTNKLRTRRDRILVFSKTF